MKPNRMHSSTRPTSRRPGFCTVSLFAAAAFSAWPGTARAELWWSGSGTWSESKWSTTDVSPSYTTAWINDGTYGPTFQGTGGTVVVAGTYNIGAPGIGFDTDGFILSGGVLVRTAVLINAPASNQ